MIMKPEIEDTRKGDPGRQPELRSTDPNRPRAHKPMKKYNTAEPLFDFTCIADSVIEQRMKEELNGIFFF